MEFRVISIGALDKHPLWGERDEVRSGHATTTLIRSGDQNILVDPSLPAQILHARLAERANLKPGDITHVFLTSFRPDVRRGLALFDGATWWVSEAEREGVGVPMVMAMQKAEEDGHRELVDALRTDIALLQRCENAPDNLARQVDLFPLHGVTPGLSGLLLAEERMTVLICGDAIPTVEHLEQGKVLPWAGDLDQARESFAEAVEIADVLIPGRDNIVPNPRKTPF